MPAAPARPMSVTLVCLFVGFSAGLLVVNLLSLLGDWGSIAMQEGLRDTLEAEPLASTNLTMDSLLATLRIAAQVIVVFCIAAAVLAVYTARGHEASRWALTVLLGLTALTFALALPTGLLLSFVAVVSISVLWSKDSRRWFAEKNGRPVPGVASPAAGPSARESAGADPFSSIAPPAPGASQAGSGRPPAAPQHAGTVPQHPAQQPAPTPAGGRRPRSVEVAVWTTVVASAVALVAGLLTLPAVTAAGPDAFRASFEQPGALGDLVRSSGWTPELMVRFLQGASVVWALLGALALVVALGLRSGRRGARTALLVMSIATIPLSALFAPAGLFHLAAAVVVLVQVTKQDTKVWADGHTTR